MEHLQFKSYLGDGIYVGFDGYQMWIWTQEGNQIALESSVFRSLKDYSDILPSRIAAARLEAAPDLLASDPQ